VSHLDTPSRGLLLAGITTDCPECVRNAASLRRLETLTRRRAHTALASGPTDPFARATRALEAAEARYEEHVQRAHTEGAAA
jgi:hypothetical protein